MYVCMYVCVCLYLYADIAVVSLYVTPELHITNFPFPTVSNTRLCTVDSLACICNTLHDKNSSCLQYFAKDGLLLIRV